MINLEKIKNKVLAWRGKGDTSLFPPHLIKFRQTLIKGLLGTTMLGGVGYMFFSSPEPIKASGDSQRQPAEQKMADLATPIEAINEREIWVNRVEKQTKKVEEEAAKFRQENEFLQKRIDVLEDLFQNQALNKEGSLNPPEIQSLNPQPSISMPMHQSPLSRSAPQSFPSSAIPHNEPETEELGQSQPLKKRGPKIAHIGGGQLSNISFKTTDLYFPAGTYSKAVVISGVAGSTATNAQSNPQPMMLRLVDDGNLPRGFKSRVKDAVILGACYGDISSERVLCRLETMSWVEPDGTTVEKKVEGWVIGEDGRAGIRGQVVDRSGEVAREAFGAGILSGISNFFKFQAQSSVYPVTPFGTTNALSNKEALQGAAASGAGSALDRLAEFSIKRAEQMQPVIMVASGRVVDIVFKTGVDLSPVQQPEMQVYGQQNQEPGESQ
jgi:conjugal transfer pilus assembly protein TraB